MAERRGGDSHWGEVAAERRVRGSRRDPPPLTRAPRGLSPRGRDGDLRRAVECLAGGGIVVYPTETLYGLGCDAENDDSLRRLVALKGRDAGKPISVLVASREMLDRVVREVTPLAERLIDAFWPGALTLVLPARSTLSPILTGGGRTIGVRISPHPAAAALVEGLGRPLTSTSANPGGAPPPTTVAAAHAYFGEAVAVYVDAGDCTERAGSTVLDCTVEPPVLFREGVLSAAAIASVAGMTPQPVPTAKR